MKAITVAFSLLLNATFLIAGIDSGGGKSLVGDYQNHSSIGAITVTGTKSVDYLRQHNGLIEILYAVPTTIALDRDRDKMPDAWEASNGLTVGIADSGNDTDGDGASNLMEYLAGTDPQDPNSAPMLTIANSGSDTTYTITLHSVKGRNYRLFVSTDLENWEPWVDFPGTGSFVTFAFDSTSPAALSRFTTEELKSTFFRIELSLAP